MRYTVFHVHCIPVFHSPWTLWNDLVRLRGGGGGSSCLSSCVFSLSSNNLRLTTHAHTHTHTTSFAVSWVDVLLDSFKWMECGTPFNVAQSALCYVLWSVCSVCVWPMERLTTARISALSNKRCLVALHAPQSWSILAQSFVLNYLVHICASQKHTTVSWLC